MVILKKNTGHPKNVTSPTLTATPRVCTVTPHLLRGLLPSFNRLRNKYGVAPAHTVIPPVFSTVTPTPHQHPDESQDPAKPNWIPNQVWDACLLHHYTHTLFPLSSRAKSRDLIKSSIKYVKQWVSIPPPPQFPRSKLSNSNLSIISICYRAKKSLFSSRMLFRTLAPKFIKSVLAFMRMTAKNRASSGLPA